MIQNGRADYKFCSLNYAVPGPKHTIIDYNNCMATLMTKIISLKNRRHMTRNSIQVF